MPPRDRKNEGIDGLADEGATVRPPVGAADGGPQAPTPYETAARAGEAESAAGGDGSTVRMRINPRFWLWDSLELEGRTFRHDEGTEVPASEVDVLKAHKDPDEGYQLVVMA